MSVGAKVYCQDWQCGLAGKVPKALDSSLSSTLASGTAHSYNRSSSAAEAGGSDIQGHPSSGYVKSCLKKKMNK